MHNHCRYEICRKLLKYLGWNQKSCLSCGREGRVEDKENFYHCVNGDCGGMGTLLQFFNYLKTLF